MKSLLALVMFALSATACDPALSYVIPPARGVRADGARYAVAVAEGVEARFHARIFTVNGYTEVQVANNSAATVEFRPAATVLTAGDGSPLPARCELPTEERVSIASGQTVTVRCTFEARLRRFSYEPEFRTLTLRQPGMSMDGKQLDIVGRMVGA